MRLSAEFSNLDERPHLHDFLEREAQERPHTFDPRKDILPEHWSKLESYVVEGCEHYPATAYTIDRRLIIAGVPIVASLIKLFGPLPEVVDNNLPAIQQLVNQALTVIKGEGHYYFYKTMGNDVPGVQSGKFINLLKANFLLFGIRPEQSIAKDAWDKVFVHNQWSSRDTVSTLHLQDIAILAPQLLQDLYYDAINNDHFNSSKKDFRRILKESKVPSLALEAQIGAMMRVAMPNRFSELELTNSDWEKLRQGLQSVGQTDGSNGLSHLEVANMGFNLAIMAAQKIEQTETDIRFVFAEDQLAFAAVEAQLPEVWKLPRRD